MLETPRLILRPMAEGDAPHLFELNSDPEVVRYTGDGPCLNLSDALKIVTDLSWPQFQKYKMGRFTVLLKDGSYLGWCGLKQFPEKNEVDLGYRFHRRHWGKGFATESSREILRYGFEDLKLKLILGKAMPENVASIKVLQSLNFSFKGLNTDPCDPRGFITYALTQEEYFRCQK